MTGDQDPVAANPLVVIWMLIRVLAGTAVWAVVFLGTLMGYLTLPILLFGAFLVVYAAVDAIRVRGHR